MNVWVDGVCKFCVCPATAATATATGDGIVCGCIDEDVEELLLFDFTAACAVIAAPVDDDAAAAGFVVNEFNIFSLVQQILTGRAAGGGRGRGGD